MSNAQANGRGEGVVGGLAEFINNVATLAELQGKLAALDFKECVGRAKLSMAVAVVGLAVLAGSVPVAVGGLGLVVSQALAIAPGWGLLLTAAVAMVAAAAIAAVAGSRVLRSFDAFRRSREELTRNVSWIRTVLVHSGRPAPRRRF